MKKKKSEKLSIKKSTLSNLTQKEIKGGTNPISVLSRKPGCISPLCMTVDNQCNVEPVVTGN
jgi:hypothetical protein